MSWFDNWRMPKWFYQMGSPKWFFEFGARWQPWFAIAALILLGWGLAGQQPCEGSNVWSERSAIVVLLDF